MAVYEIHLTDPFGLLLDVIDNWFFLSYTRVVNDIGALELRLDGEYPISNIKVDGRVLVYRNGRLEVDTPWLIRKWEKQLSTDGVRFLTVYAVSPNEILTRRVIPYASDSASGAISDYPDNIMKAIVRSYFLTDAITGSSYRDISTYFSCEADASLGISTCKTFSNANVFDALQEITQSSITDGSAVYFDVIATASNNFHFCTFKTLRGVNNTYPFGAAPITFSPDNGNLSNVTLSFDRTQEITGVYVYGQGVGSERPSASAFSATRINESPFNLREAFDQGNNTSSSGMLGVDAKAALRAGRPIRTFEGELVNVPGTYEYRVHWNLGDMITVSFDGDNFDCTINSISITVQGGKEEITGALRVEEG